MTEPRNQQIRSVGENETAPQAGARQGDGDVSHFARADRGAARSGRAGREDRAVVQRRCDRRVGRGRRQSREAVVCAEEKMKFRVLPISARSLRRGAPSRVHAVVRFCYYAPQR